MILIYDDLGVSKDSVDALVELLSDREAVRCISGADIQHNNALGQATCLIIPGGRSLPFYECLGAAGNKAIIDFVNQGGRYVGLCAGAYYAAKETVFAEGLPLELLLPGALNFFQGRAIGPVFAALDFAYQTEQGAAIIDITLNNSKKYAVYFNGGCYFELPEAMPHTTLIARYDSNQKAAIIACRVGKGCAVLSGVHPELSVDEPSRKQLLKQLVEPYKG